MTELSYDLEPKEIPVTLSSKRGKKSYVLREPSTHAATRYRNATLSAAKMEDGKINGMDGLADAEPLLVSLCLFVPMENRPPEQWATVPIQEVMAFPNRVQADLFAKIKELDPSITGDETVESMEKQVEDLMKRIAEKRGETAPKG